MFGRKVKTNKGIVQVGKFGIDRIDVDTDTMTANIYTVGGNVFERRLKKILDDGKVVCNSRNHHKNLY